MNKENPKCSTCLIENEDTSLSQREMNYIGNLGMIEDIQKNGLKTKGQKGLYQCSNCKEVVIY